MSAEIMCTLSASQVSSPGMLMALRDAGMRSVRINTAHLDSVATLQEIVDRIKSFDESIKVLIDTKGPELRTTTCRDDAPVRLLPDARVEVAGSSRGEFTSATRIYVNFQRIGEHLTAGDTLLVDDGRIELLVTGITSTGVAHATVKRGGQLGSRKGVSVKGKSLPLPAVSQRDRMFIEYAAACEAIDAIAHSFVRSADDVRAVIEAMGDARKRLVAKIENRQGIDNLADIMPLADAVLIARGDMTAEIGAAAVPQAQERIASMARSAAREVYLATNILPSMIRSAKPSDEDVAGVRKALSQGVDVLLLTNETAQGDDPVNIVATLYKIITNQND